MQKIYKKLLVFSQKEKLKPDNTSFSTHSFLLFFFLFVFETHSIKAFIYNLNRRNNSWFMERFSTVYFIKDLSKVLSFFKKKTEKKNLFAILYNINRKSHILSISYVFKIWKFEDFFFRWILIFCETILYLIIFIGEWFDGRNEIILHSIEKLIPDWCTYLFLGLCLHQIFSYNNKQRA